MDEITNAALWQYDQTFNINVCRMLNKILIYSDISCKFWKISKNIRKICKKFLELGNIIKLKKIWEKFCV